MFQLVIEGRISEYEEVNLKSVSLGDFKLKSTVLPEAEGFMDDHCHGEAVANVFFGEAGVGKSTIASLGTRSVKSFRYLHIIQ